MLSIKKYIYKNLIKYKAIILSKKKKEKKIINFFNLIYIRIFEREMNNFDYNFKYF